MTWQGYITLDEHGNYYSYHHPDKGTDTQPPTLELCVLEVTALPQVFINNDDLPF